VIYVMRMKCEEMLQQLSDYVDGSIEPGMCRELEQHLAGCEPCEVVVDTLRKTITIYREGKTVEMPGTFREKLHDCLRRKWKEKNG
jgi:anti-sigma factor RsiW